MTNNHAETAELELKSHLDTIEKEYQQKIDEVVSDIDVDNPDPYHLKRIMSLIVGLNISIGLVFKNDPSVHISEIKSALDGEIKEIQPHNREMLESVVRSFFNRISDVESLTPETKEKYNLISQALIQTVNDDERLDGVIKSQPPAVG